MLGITGAWGLCFLASDWPAGCPGPVVRRPPGADRGSGTAAALPARGFAGLLVVGWGSGGGTGAWLSLLAAAAVTAGTLPARALPGADLVAASAWHFLIGGAALAAVAAAVEPDPAINWTPRFTAVQLFLALVGTAAAFLAWFTDAAHSRLDLLTAWTLLVPVIGIRRLPVPARGAAASGWGGRGGAGAGIAFPGA